LILRHFLSGSKAIVLPLYCHSTGFDIGFNRQETVKPPGRLSLHAWQYVAVQVDRNARSYCGQDGRRRSRDACRPTGATSRDAPARESFLLHQPRDVLLPVFAVVSPDEKAMIAETKFELVKPASAQ
jgi:hypothetical protein